MALHPLKYKVSDRWLDDEVYDAQGFRIKTPNPDPTVTVLQGVWRKKVGDLEKFQMSSKEFRALTGIIVYGGSISKRGTTITHISDDVYRRIQNRWLKGETSTESVWKKSKAQASQPHKSRLERAVRGTTRNTGIPVRVRKKK